MPSTSIAHPNPNALAIHWVFPRARVTHFRKRATLGRGDACSVVLRGQEVSRSHCVIAPSTGALVVEDLGSRNGTFVNGRRVAKAELVAGTVVRLGDWVGLVRRSSELTAENLVFDEVAPGLYGSGKLRGVLDSAKRLANENRALRIEGEMGTGKTLIANAVHELSERPGQFVSMNCAGVPAHVTEAELFGAAPCDGVDTPRPRPGRLRAAHCGTLLLEDVACLPLSVQSRLLDAFVAKAVGYPGSEATDLDLRVIVAAHEPLERALEDGRIQPDLYAWLGSSLLTIPSLRDRAEDIGPLFQQFLRQLSSRGHPDIEPRLIERLCLYDWPYNVQELRSLAEGLLAVYGKRSALTGSILPERMAAEKLRSTFSRSTPDPDESAWNRHSAKESGTLPIGRDSLADEQALAMLVDALRFCHHDLGRACSLVGLSRFEANRLLESAAFLEAQQSRARSRKH